MVKTITKRARSLRKKQTPTEAKVWAILRNRRLAGVKFYRQFPIGPYITDFCSQEKKLVIEVDGGGHNTPRQKEKDRERDIFLNLSGLSVLRVWSSEVNNNLAGVVEAILNSISQV